MVACPRVLSWRGLFAELAPQREASCLQQLSKLLYSKTGMPDDRTEGTLGDLFVVGYDDSSMRRLRLAEDNVTAALPIELEADFAERLDGLAARDDG